jgi:hypothetical protein
MDDELITISNDAVTELPIITLKKFDSCRQLIYNLSYEYDSYCSTIVKSINIYDKLRTIFLATISKSGLSPCSSSLCESNKKYER